MTESCQSPCRSIAVLEERIAQIEKRQGGDIDRLEKAIEELTRAVTVLTQQADRWKGGVGMLMALAGASGGLGGLIGFLAGKGH